MSQEKKVSEVVSCRPSDSAREQIQKAMDIFGVTPGVLGRMALDAFMPTYLAARGCTANIEFLATIGAAIEANPEIKADLEKFLRNRVRKSRTAA